MPGGNIEPHIRCQHPARDARHAADHQREQFALRHAGKVGLDHQRRLGLAHEDVRRRREAFAAAGPHHALHHPGHGADDPLQDAVVIQQRRQRRDEDDRRGHHHHEDEAPAGTKRAIQQFPVGQRTKHQPGAFLRAIEQAHEGVLSTGKYLFPNRRFKDENRQDELQPQPGQHRAPREAPPVRRARPRQRYQRHQPQQADQLHLHGAGRCQKVPPSSREACARIATGAHLFIVVDEIWSSLTPALSPRRGGAIQQSERFIVLAAFDSAANAEESVLPSRPWPRSLSLGERAGVRASVFQPR